jgi:tryptophanyl-tRNA synthetase
LITKKIKRCKSDAFEGLEWDNPDRPECTNLLNIYQSVTGKTREVGRLPRDTCILPLDGHIECCQGLMFKACDSIYRRGVCQDILNEVSGYSWGKFKPVLADAVVAHLDPIQKR